MKKNLKLLAVLLSCSFSAWAIDLSPTYIKVAPRYENIPNPYVGKNTQLPVTPTAHKNKKHKGNTELDYKIINAYFQKGQIDYAKKLSLEYLKLYPDDPDVQLVLGQVFLKERNFKGANAEFEWILVRYPNYSDARIFLADVAVAQGDSWLAIQIINKGLMLYPNDSYLLNKKAQLFFDRGQYPEAAAWAKRAIRKDPNNSNGVDAANEILDNVKEITPYYTYGLNEIGFYTENDHVYDLQSTWDYSTLYYSHDTSLGRIAIADNYANRNGTGASQGELDFSPIINKYIYFDLMGAYAQQPLLFPDYVYGGEGHFSIPKFLDLSFGATYSSIVNTYFTRYTTSLSKYVGNYWFSFQPFYFDPKSGPTSILYTVTGKRYFSTVDHSIAVTLGSGRSPDLAELESVDFFTIRNDFIFATYEFPIINHHLVVDIGGDYQRWVFPPPSNLVRKFAGVTGGLKFRF